MTDNAPPVPADTVNDDKVDAMLDMVKDHCAQQCRIIDDVAQAEAHDIIASAHKDARSKVHDVIVEERRIGQRAIDKQRAKIETAKRQNLQDRENAFLDVAWQQLNIDLGKRWLDDAGRKEWLSGIVDQALAHLHPGAWRIEHPHSWSPNELKSDLDRIKAFSGADPEFVSTPDFDIGVRIQANGVIVDATLSGVLADEKEIAAMLLAELFLDAEVTS